MSPWENALTTVARTIMGNSNQEPIPWLVVGSVASVLQGCKMDPRDLDILFPSRDYLTQYVSCVPRKAPDDEPPSITSESFSSGFEWHKVQHEVDGFLVDAVYIASGGDIPDSTAGCGVWEGGPLARTFARTVQFHDFGIQVVPLEIQLESQIRRGRQDRAEAIAAVLRTTCCDPEMLKQFLGRDHFEAWSIKLRANSP